MNRLVGLALATLLFGACASSHDDASTRPVADRVVITWFVGLGTGSQPEHLQPQERVVDQFNRSQETIQLELEIVDYSAAYDDLWARIGRDEAPDIVGPVGIQGANEFDGEFLDLAPYLDIEELADVDPAQVALLDDDGSLWGLPIGVFPSMLFVNTELFSRAGLELPPTEPGGLYEGRPWDMAALTDLSERLTLDSAGRNAQDPAFDRSSVVQWGFHHQHLGDPRSHGTFFGPGELERDGRAAIPEVWMDEWRWLHSMIHDKGVSPDIDQEHSDVLRGGNAFATGRVAIAYSHLWYVPSITSADGVPLTFWRFAMVPENRGAVTAKVHADSLRVLASTEHPEEAAEGAALPPRGGRRGPAPGVRELPGPARSAGHLRRVAGEELSPGNRLGRDRSQPVLPGRSEP